jgi:hypothetical protein
MSKEAKSSEALAPIAAQKHHVNILLIENACEPTRLGKDDVCHTIIIIITARPVRKAVKHKK